MDDFLNRAWALINLDNIAHNIKEIRRLTGDKSEIIGVVKADAYGHGVAGVLQTLLENGVKRLAVSMLDEALELRKNGIGVPILVLSYTAPSRAVEIIRNNITQTVFSRDLALALSNAAMLVKKEAKIHVKVDTGMSRVGFPAGYVAVKEISKIGSLPGITIEGIFTHFASADESDAGEYTVMQFEKFMSICMELARVGIYIPVKHACNSAGIMAFPEMHLDAVRPGIMMFGYYPSEEMGKNVQLKPAMTFKANVILVKDVDKDTFVSYGRKFKTKRASKLATISVGYADGYPRCIDKKGRVLINGEYAPIVGAICMDQCIVDVTDLDKEVQTGDEVVIFGQQQDKQIPVEEVAQKAGTINYETISVVGRRVPRAYIKDGKILRVKNYLLDPGS
ncbi:MAG: alanine racemase [Oscillospiraceae bacterium]|nr:alanine racemase [Oscillospiraceae bacterium]